MNIIVNFNQILKKRRLFIKLAPYITILVAGIIAYRKIIFSSGPTVQMHDIPILFYPTYLFVKQSFLSGQIPFWDPHLVFGQPLLFNFGLGLLYFPLLFLLRFSHSALLVPRHLELLIISHLIFSGLTMYWGMRKIGVAKPGACLGGIVFQLYVGNQELIVLPPVCFGLPWVPLAVFYFFACLSSNNKENQKKWHSLRDGAILIFSLFMLISATHPHLLAYTYFQIFFIALFFSIYYLFRKNLRGAFNCFKKSLFYALTPILLAGFIILPLMHYLPQTTRWLPVESHRNIGPLYKPYLATIFIPTLAKRFSSPFAYTGILTIFLALGYCFLVSKKDRKKYDFFWVLAAVFWVLFSIESSPLYSTVLKHIPGMQSMRFTQRGMIFYTLSIALLAGRFFNILCLGWRKVKFYLSPFLIFPVFLLGMLIFIAKPLLELVKSYPVKIDYHIAICLISAGIFTLALFIHNRTKNNIFRIFIKILIPIWLIVEMLSICSLKIGYSRESTYAPYSRMWQEQKQKYPEVYNAELGLYRVENYSEPMIVPYYHNTYSTHGYLSQATHPRRYYYLWHDHGGWFGYKYFRFWDLAYLPFSSPIYDLMGVKYFIADEGTEAFPLSREIRGQGEWVEGTLSKPDYISAIRIYNTIGNYHRRMIKGHLDLDGKLAVSFEMPIEPGWYEFRFKPKSAENFKLTVDKVKTQVWNGTDGVIIGELELCGLKGEKIEIDSQSLKVSSTFWHCHESRLVDGNIERPWESGSRVALKEMMETDTVKEIKRGLFINQNVLPRAFMVRKIKVLGIKDAKEMPDPKKPEELSKKLHSKDFNPREVMLLGKQPKNPINIENKTANDNITITNYRLNKVDIEAAIETPGYLVLSDTHLPGWSVRVNGKPKELLKVYGYFRAVGLEKGHNKITFRYFPPMLKLGMLISLFTFIALMFIGLKAYRKKKYAAG